MRKRTKKAPVAKPVDSLRARFEDAHVKGMDALKRGDYDALGKAIDAERAIIDELPAPPSSTKTKRR